MKHQLQLVALAEEESFQSENNHEASSAAVVIVNSDDDFNTSGWTGNGTIDNPYVLANKTIEGERCIQIEDTRCHFRIENCTLDAVYYGITLFNATNAVLIDCTIDSEQLCISVHLVTNASILHNSIYSAERGIEIEQSSLCGVVNNSIETRCTGVALFFSGQCHIANNSVSCSIEENLVLSKSNSTSVIENTFLGGDSGLFSWESHDCDIFNNTIASNGYAIHVRESSNGSIIGNQFGSVAGETALDDGTDNSWDDGVSLGNAWLDYDGIGEYQIPGMANSIDHFPTKFEPLFPMDFDGPSISIPFYFVHFDYIGEIPASYRFCATVTDPSEVDTVIITVNGGAHVMNHQPTPEDPDLYIFDYPNPGAMRHSYWANDSVGHSSATEEGFISMGIIAGTVQDTARLYMTIGGLLVLVGAIVVLVRRLRPK